MRRTTSLAVVVCVSVCLTPLLVRARQAGARARLRHTVADSVAARWSPDNRTLAVATGGKSLALYDAAEGKARVEIKLERYLFAAGSVLFTPDGRTLIVHTDRVSLYDAADGRLLREFAEKTEPINHYEKFYKPEERETLEKDEVTGLNRKETVYPGEGAETEELPMRYLSDRVVSPDGSSLLVRAKEGRAQVYDLSTGALKFTLEPVPDTPRRKLTRATATRRASSAPTAASSSRRTATTPRASGTRGRARTSPRCATPSRATRKPIATTNTSGARRATSSSRPASPSNSGTAAASCCRNSTTKTR